MVNSIKGVMEGSTGSMRSWKGQCKGYGRVNRVNGRVNSIKRSWNNQQNHGIINGVMEGPMGSWKGHWGHGMVNGTNGVLEWSKKSMEGSTRSNKSCKGQ